jgi:hypothetical protein
VNDIREDENPDGGGDEEEGPGPPGENLVRRDGSGLIKKVGLKMKVKRLYYTMIQEFPGDI